MLAQIHWRLQDYSNKVQENGVTVKHLHEEQKGKDDPPIQTSRKKKKEKEQAHSALSDCKPQPPSCVRTHSEQLPGKADVTSKVKPFHGLIFLGSHPTETERLGQTRQWESIRNWVVWLQFQVLSIWEHKHWTNSCFVVLSHLKSQWQDLLWLSHIRPLYFYLQAQRHIQAHTHTPAQKACGIHTHTPAG